jgi:hypothetical protein
MNMTQLGISRISKRAPLRIAVTSFLLTVVVLLPLNSSLAAGAPLAKTTIVTGLVSECNVGVNNDEILRPLVIRLHQRPSGRIVAIYTVEPTSQEGTFAFSARPGTYFLTTSERTSVPPRGNIIIRATTKTIIKVNIATTCQ